MGEVKYPSNAEAFVSELKDEQTFKSAGVGNAVKDFNNYGIVAFPVGATALNSRNFTISGTTSINVGIITGAESGGIAYTSNGDRIAITSNVTWQTTTYTPPFGWPVVDPYGNPLQQISGNINIPFANNAGDNFVYIDYIQVVDPSKTVIDEEPSANNWYTNYNDGYAIYVELTATPPTATSIYLGKVTTVNPGTPVISTIDQTGLTYTNINPDRVTITTPTDSTDKTAAYTYGATYNLETHIKAQGTGAMTPANPHGMSLSDLGVTPDQTVGAHQQYLHASGINNTSLSTAYSTSALYPDISGITILTIKPLVAINPTTGAGEFLVISNVAYDSTSAVSYVTDVHPSGITSQFGLPYSIDFSGKPAGTYTFYVDITVPTLPVLTYTSSFTPVVSKYPICAAVWSAPNWTSVADLRVLNSNAPVNVVSAESNFPASPKNGTMIMDKTTGLIWYYDGSVWEQITISSQPTAARGYCNAFSPYSNPSTTFAYPLQTMNFTTVPFGYYTSANVGLAATETATDVPGTPLTNAFLIKKSGYYQLNASVSYHNTDVTSNPYGFACEIWTQRAATPGTFTMLSLTQQVVKNSATTDLTMKTSDIFYFNVGDTVHARSYSALAGPTVTINNSATETYFSIAKVGTL